MSPVEILDYELRKYVFDIETENMCNITFYVKNQTENMFW